MKNQIQVKHENMKEFKELTMKQSKQGRSSNLGNYVFKSLPRNVLPTLHNKTYFKACETILLGESVKGDSLKVDQNEL